MTREDFNKKYIKYLQEGHYGLDINNKKVIEFLDTIFPVLIEEGEDFMFTQIKLKFNNCTFYAQGTERRLVSFIQKNN